MNAIYELLPRALRAVRRLVSAGPFVSYSELEEKILPSFVPSAKKIRGEMWSDSAYRDSGTIFFEIDPRQPALCLN